MYTYHDTRLHLAVLNILYIVLYRARDWGKTDYRIIRTWTPRAPPPPAASNSDRGHQGEERLTHDITSKSRDSQKDSTEGAPTDANDSAEEVDVGSDEEEILLYIHHTSCTSSVGQPRNCAHAQCGILYLVCVCVRCFPQ